MTNELPLQQRMAEGLRLGEDNDAACGSDVADWLVANAVINDRAAAADTILRLVDFGILERVFREGENEGTGVFEAHFRVLQVEEEESDAENTQRRGSGLGWVAFLNPLSGGHRAKHLYKQLQELLPRERVCDMTSPSERLRGMREWQSNRSLKVLVCGGDGTIRWVMDSFAGAHPTYGIVPLGTGNDMGVSLGWKTLGRQKAATILARLYAATLTRIDRWLITLQKRGTTAVVSELSVPEVATMNNYLSIGTDAKAAMRYHELRNKTPGLFPTPAAGKSWYTYFGTVENCKRVLGGATPLRECVTLVVDGVHVTLPPRIAAIAVLSTPSIYGGVRAWKGDCSPGDGIVEVVAVRGAFHMLAMLAHASSAITLARGAEVELICSEPMPAQIDGEPFLMSSPMKITVKRSDFAFVLERDRTKKQKK